jgi:hypothetical protein
VLLICVLTLEVSLEGMESEEASACMELRARVLRASGKYQDALHDFQVCVCVCVNVGVWVCGCVHVCMYMYVCIYIPRPKTQDPRQGGV